ncbi:hypothetical protein FE840_016620 [Peteryoungia desertarenae]|uniref:Uncharacterized protein n=1 Tax=Peteryoungia desertarenae TaxID=1813451 RepID=A0ABX6QS79_9HYPH|nr:hypothetical protein [Peteryoungia desertarenae]QLF71042.1 hypothetical protein FE840_016620 [Peteryoungia desertarenae]
MTRAADECLTGEVHPQLPYTGTPLTFFQKARLVWLALFAPQAFISEEEADNAKLNAAPTSAHEGSRLHAIRSGLCQSAFWGLVAMGTGFAIGSLLGASIGPQLEFAIGIVVVGTTILMWATLALQGWSIQSFKGNTLSERLNQWIFRTLYVIGTALISAGSVWSLF